jgi:hypothetical protein
MSRINHKCLLVGKENRDLSITSPKFLEVEVVSLLPISFKDGIFRDVEVLDVDSLDEHLSLLNSLTSLALYVLRTRRPSLIATKMSTFVCGDMVGLFCVE